MQYIPGIDVSHWQATIDWQTVAGAGKHYAYIKATEGSSFVDPSFERNWRGAKEAGLLRGGYHFFRPLVDARKQAQHFIKTLPIEAGDLPPALDLEVNDRLRRNTFIERVEIWIKEVEDATGLKPVIYSGVSFLDSNFTNATGGPPLWARNHILWIANYRGLGATVPTMPRGWKQWTFWQHSASGRVDGIQGNVDLDWFNGSIDELFTLAGKSTDDVSPGDHGAREYKVKAGDTLRTIANKFNLPLHTLVRANPQLLKLDMTLTIPSSGDDHDDEDGDIVLPPEVYFVQPGDTLGLIASRFNTTITKLAKANNIADPDLIRVGQRLLIP